MRRFFVRRAAPWRASTAASLAEACFDIPTDIIIMLIWTWKRGEEKNWNFEYKIRLIWARAVKMLIQAGFDVPVP